MLDGNVHSLQVLDNFCVRLTKSNKKILPQKCIPLNFGVTWPLCSKVAQMCDLYSNAS